MGNRLKNKASLESFSRRTENRVPIYVKHNLVIMKTRGFYLFLAYIATTLVLSAQENDKNDFAIKFGGFIKNDFFFDSRQTVAAREGHFLLWPAKPELDAEGKDINAVPSFNFLSIQTRLNASISAPKTFGVKTTGFIEGAFFGHTNADINGFRLRHAFLKLEWENTELLFGQFWNPLFIHTSFPDVVSFNTGCPFQPFSRNPQIRLTQSFGKLKVIAAANSQRDFASVGPAGASSVYLRNAAIPDLHLQVHYTIPIADKEAMLDVGGGAAYKKIVPELKTPQGYKTDAGVTGISFMGFAKARFKPLTMKAQYLLGQNVSDLLLIGGYGLSEVVDTEKGIAEYAPLQTQNAWLEIHTNGKEVQFGLFLGLSENLGATENLAEETNLTGFGTDIKTLYRISPRVIFNSGKARFALECEYTAANYGTIDLNQNSKGIPLNVEEVANLRLLFAVYLFL